jgi:hypothetical protein
MRNPDHWMQMAEIRDFAEPIPMVWNENAPFCF